MEEELSPLLGNEEATTSPLDATPANYTEQSTYLKNFAFLSSLAKLPELPQEDILKALEDETVKAENTINSTGDTVALEETARSREIARAVFTGMDPSLPSEERPDFLAQGLQMAMKIGSPTYRQAAEALVILPTLDGEEITIPDVPGAFELQATITERRLALLQEIQKQSEERGNVTMGERGWANLWMLPQELLDMATPIRNTAIKPGTVPGVDKNIGDYFLPGMQQNQESNALFDPTIISDEEFDKILPEVVKNTFDRTLMDVQVGGTPVQMQNQLFAETLQHELWDAPSAWETNFFAAADALGLIYPLGKMGLKGLSTLDLLKGYRQAKLASQLTVRVVEESKAGKALETVAKARGTTADEVLSNILTKAMDPEAATETGVSLAGRTQKIYEDIQTLLDEAKVINLDDLNRLKPEELEKAMLATVQKVEKRTGRKFNIADAQVYNSTPGTGTFTPSLRLLIGKADGSGYKQLSSLNRWAESVGLAGFKTQRIPRAVSGTPQPALVRAPAQFDEAFVDLVERMKNVPPDYQKGNVFTSATGKNNNEVFEDIKTYVNSTGDDVEVLVTKNGNIIAGSKKELGDKSLKELLGYDDADVGSFIMTKKDTKISLDKLYGSVRKSGGDKFDLIGDEVDDLKGVSAVKDENSGEWFMVFETGIEEEGFFDPLEQLMGTFGGRLAAKVHLGLARFLSGGRLIETKDLYGAAALAESRRNAIIQHLNKVFNPKFKAINKEERALLNTIVRVEDKEARWMGKDELMGQFYFKFGPGSDPKRFLDAHMAFRQINDIDWFLRNANVYSDLSTRGYRTVALRGMYGSSNYAPHTAKVETDLVGARPKTAVFDAEEGKMVDMNTLDRKAYQDQGFVLVRYLDTQKFGANGYMTKYALIRKSNIDDMPLNRVQLGYRPGGHRIYDKSVRYWIKGAHQITDPLSGKPVLLDPITLKGGLTRVELESYLNKLNEYVKQAEITKKAGTKVVSRSKLVKLREETPELPEISKIYEMIDDGRASSARPFEIVEDRKMPSQYSVDPDVLDYVDESVNQVYDHMRSTGRLYYSKRGDEIMTDFMGNDLPVLDVYESTRAALANITQSVAMNPYKISKMERWVAQYKDLLQLKPNMSLDQMFNAEFRTNLKISELSKKNAAETQRSVTRRLINWISPRGRWTDKTWSQMLHWIEHSNEKKGVEATQKALRIADKFAEWVSPNATASFLKGYAFDVKLGLLNIAQIPLQLATTWSIMGIDTTKTLRAIELYPLVRMYNPASDHKALRAVFASQPAGKVLGGFDDVEELISMLDQMKQKSGFSIVNRTHAVLDQVSEGNAFGLTNGIMDGVQRLREATRFIFYETERVNKAVAWQVAWKMVREESPELAYTSQRFIERVSGKASTLAMGMDNASSAAWQKGIASIPTQFWTYPVRSMEMALGKELTYTQKIRFFLGQGTLFGAPGVPLVSFFVDRYNQEHGVPHFEEDPFWTFVQRGTFDTMLYYGTGADVLYGERVGTGRWAEDIVREMIGQSRFGPTAPADMAGGASFSIFFDTVGGLGRAAKYFDLRAFAGMDEDVTAEEAGELFFQAASDFARVSSSWNNYLKASSAWNAGMLLSRKKPGKDVYLIADDVNRQEALFLAMGLDIAETRDIGAALAYTKNRKGSIKDLVGSWKQADLLFVEGMRTNDTAKMRRAETLIKTLNMSLPEELREDFFDELYRYEYSTPLAKAIVEAHQEQMLRDKMTIEMNKDLEERVNNGEPN